MAPRRLRRGTQGGDDCQVAGRVGGGGLDGHAVLRQDGHAHPQQAGAPGEAAATMDMLASSRAG